jgi:hypothetical protein
VRGNAIWRHLDDIRTTTLPRQARDQDDETERNGVVLFSAAGASHYRRLAQYFVAMALLQSPFNEPSYFCIQPMVMKQGAKTHMF